MIDTLEPIESKPLATPNQLSPERAVADGQAVGGVALAVMGIELSIRHFYGGEKSFMGKTPDGEHRMIIGSEGFEGNGRKVVGVGTGVETALRDSLDRMRALETVHTRSLARIEMTDTAFVSFTTLEHYSPKVAPSQETYAIPNYLEASLTDSGDSNHTYRNTVEQEGWQTELRDVLAGYLQNDPDGQQLARSLKIRSLSHLTPEQAVKLSAAFVQNVSRYSEEDVGAKDLTRADRATATELLQEGIANKDNPAWRGNGVCRNIASDIKAVFEALKATQSELSMLNNTYAVYGGGYDGAGYADSRADGFSTKIGGITGHAWDTFVTIDRNGSAVATIVDATWALDSDADSAIQHLDRTEVRAATQLMQLFEKSEVKAQAFGGLTRYTERLIKGIILDRRLSAHGHDNIRAYVTTEYLKAAAQLPELPEDFNLPDAIVGVAYRLRGDLERKEIATLFALDKASGINEARMKAFIADYDGKRRVPIPGWQSAENLVFNDDELQALAYDAVGEPRVLHLSDQSGAFRARLRELRPEALPAFDAFARPADAKELSHFASQNGVHEKDPRTIMRQLKSRLKKLAGDDAVYDAIVVGRSDYDLAKHFGAIKRALRSRPKS